MSSKLIIKKLFKALNTKKDDVIQICEEMITENFSDAVNEPTFYSLPFNEITSIIKKVNFIEECKPQEFVKLLESVVRGISNIHQTEAILLLNEIKISNLPQLTIDNIIEIISKFTKSELLVRLGELYKESSNLVEVDWEYEIEQKNKQIEKLKKQIYLFKSQRPMEKPRDFEENVFTACKNGKLNSVRYHFEVLGASKEAVSSDYPFGTVLHVACWYNQLAIVKYLCEVQNVKTEIKDRDGLTPLHIACNWGYLSIVRYLCEVQHVNLNSRNKSGHTPLYIAQNSYNDTLGVIDYLASIGANR